VTRTPEEALQMIEVRRAAPALPRAAQAGPPTEWRATMVAPFLQPWHSWYSFMRCG
jgi:hypothetical protein